MSDPVQSVPGFLTLSAVCPFPECSQIVKATVRRDGKFAVIGVGCPHSLSVDVELEVKSAEIRFSQSGE